MVMDKEWMHMTYRVDPKYLEGARRFADQAQANAGHPEKILCPCNCCLNAKHQHFDMVFRHLLENGMDQSYTIWYFHGENLSESLRHGSDVNDVEMPETYQNFYDSSLRQSYFFGFYTVDFAATSLDFVQ
ncbi:uncharacterized protein LOC132311264 [Cornus florida]|uniref:uncharacterized protein LOC132311264 n=1 Tax=Cornus florida TaxID=4283 RepID=UPI00289D821F|nr:uncharacterized protein LOC132311264 [Cornus florida]